MFTRENMTLGKLHQLLAKKCKYIINSVWVINTIIYLNFPILKNIRKVYKDKYHSVHIHLVYKFILLPAQPAERRTCMLSLRKLSKRVNPVLMLHGTSTMCTATWGEALLYYIHVRQWFLWNKIVYKINVAIVIMNPHVCHYISVRLTPLIIRRWIIFELGNEHHKIIKRLEVRAFLLLITQVIVSGSLNDSFNDLSLHRWTPQQFSTPLPALAVSIIKHPQVFDSSYTRGLLT